MSSRVAVTGIGVVSPFGVGIDALWSAVLEGRSCARASPPSARGIAVPPRAGTLDGVAADLGEVLDARSTRRLSSFSRTALAASVLASRGLSAPRDDVAVVLGTSYGSSSYHFEYYERVFRGGIKDASPLLFSESVMNAASGHVSIHLKLRGASLALVGGEEVGLAAVLDAADKLRLGEAAGVLAGGAEEYCDFVHAALASRGLVAAAGDADPVFSEGAAVLLLEDLQAANGAPFRPLAWLAGTGAERSLDGLGGLPAAVEEASRAALREAGTDPRDVGLVVASSSGAAWSFLEAEGVMRALGGRREVPFWWPKAVLGEGFAFTSAAQAALAVKALAEGTAPPSSGRAAAPLEDGHVLVVSSSSRGNALAAVFSAASSTGAVRP